MESYPLPAPAKDKGPFSPSSCRSAPSATSRKNPRNINDGEDPASSDDPSSYFDWFPTKDSTEWVEMAFEKPATVSECQVYWFDDTGKGEVRVPATWRLLVGDGSVTRIGVERTGLVLRSFNERPLSD